MAVEAGAKNGVIACDEITRAYLRERGVPEGEAFRSDPGADYMEDLSFSAGELAPLCACPHEVDNVTEIANVGDVAIHQALYRLLYRRAVPRPEGRRRLLKGKKIAKGIRLLVSPASREVWEACDRDGILTTLSEAGPPSWPPAAGPAWGSIRGPLGRERSASRPPTRNFIGRMGSKYGDVYLASPLSVAASAVTGRLTDPRTML